MATITKLQVEAGVTDVSLLNFVVSDGATLIATRYVSRDDCPAATMYYAQGASSTCISLNFSPCICHSDDAGHKLNPFIRHKTTSVISRKTHRSEESDGLSSACIHHWYTSTNRGYIEGG